MIDQHPQMFNKTSPASYRIRIRGRIDARWSDYLQGMKVSVVEEKEGAVFSELSGLLPDQAALMGVLQQLCDLGACLISVDCTSILSRDE